MSDDEDGGGGREEEWWMMDLPLLSEQQCVVSQAEAFHGVSLIRVVDECLSTARPNSANPFNS